MKGMKLAWAHAWNLGSTQAPYISLIVDVDTTRAEMPKVTYLDPDSRAADYQYIHIISISIPSERQNIRHSRIHPTHSPTSYSLSNTHGRPIDNLSWKSACHSNLTSPNDLKEPTTQC